MEVWLSQGRLMKMFASLLLMNNNQMIFPRQQIYHGPYKLSLVVSHFIQEWILCIMLIKAPKHQSCEKRL